MLHPISPAGPRASPSCRPRCAASSPGSAFCDALDTLLDRSALLPPDRIVEGGVHLLRIRNAEEGHVAAGEQGCVVASVPVLPRLVAEIDGADGVRAFLQPHGAKQR